MTTEVQPLLLPIARDPIVFTVSGVPVPKGRPRARVIQRYATDDDDVGDVVGAGAPRLRGRANSMTASDFRALHQRRKVYVAQMYTPAETVAAEQVFLQLAMPHRPRKPLTGPLRVDLVFVMPIPSSWHPREKAAATNGARWPTGKPDRDNLEKLVLDALNKVFYLDDSQVCTGEITKIYGLDPRTEVRITPLIEGEMNG
jgi:Holliday junction resolvase RusA-like endonuclease